MLIARNAADSIRLILFGTSMSLQVIAENPFRHPSFEFIGWQHGNIAQQLNYALIRGPLQFLGKHPRTPRRHLFQIVLVVLFRHVKLGGGFNVDILFLPIRFLRHLLLFLVAVHDGGSVLPLVWVGRVLAAPEIENGSVRDDGRIVLDEQGFRVILYVVVAAGVSRMWF